MCHSRRAGRQTCLGQDVPDMPVDGMLAELEVRRGFFVAETTCDELEHLDLTRRETAKFCDWADRSVRLEVELLEEDANGCRVSYSPNWSNAEPALRRARLAGSRRPSASSVWASCSRDRAASKGVRFRSKSAALSSNLAHASLCSPLAVRRRPSA